MLFEHFKREFTAEPEQHLTDFSLALINNVNMKKRNHQSKLIVFLLKINSSQMGGNSLTAVYAFEASLLKSINHPYLSEIYLQLL
jgi:hypothetical protein